MRASTDQVRTATLDAVDAARNRATGLVHHGADLVGTTIERGASTLEDGVERVSDKVSSGAVTAAGAAVTAAAKPVRHRLRTLLIALVVVTVGFVVAKKVLGGSDMDEERAGDNATPSRNGDDPARASDTTAAATAAGG